MQRKNLTQLVTLADFVRTERQARGLSRRSLSRRSGGDAGRGDILTIELGHWPKPAHEVLDGIARGLECDDEQKAADLWAKMMVLSGHLSRVQIAAIKRLPTRIRIAPGLQSRVERHNARVAAAEAEKAGEAAGSGRA
jgi:transcriptional regulator with XRE-family HTH domain